MLSLSTRHALAPVLAIALVSSACASKAWTHRAATASQQLSASAERLQTTVISLHAQGEMTADELARWQRNFERMAKVGLAFNEAVRAGDGATAHAQIQAGVTLVETLVRDDVIRVPERHRLTVTIALEAVRSVLLTLSAAVPA